MTWDDIRSAKFSKRLSVLSWMVPRILLVALFCVPSLIRYAEIAEHVKPDCATSGLLQRAIFALSLNFPSSIYAIFAVVLLLLLFVRINVVTATVAVAVLLSVTLLPSFWLGCR